MSVATAPARIVRRISRPGARVDPVSDLKSQRLDNLHLDARVVGQRDERHFDPADRLGDIGSTLSRQLGLNAN
ncbi:MULTISPECIES: hypothetical protein [Burkholderiaceae]|jgi:hypothetical protein|uniref:hypothetical protein n=1 Tax=Burkholderiaceae TaxID=119060 RepID=UPI0011785CED|nr:MULTISPECIES: hypothetical protein [Burkholderiaceae]